MQTKKISGHRRLACERHSTSRAESVPKRARRPFSLAAAKSGYSDRKSLFVGGRWEAGRSGESA